MKIIFFSLAIVLSLFAFTSELLRISCAHRFGLLSNFKIPSTLAFSYRGDGSTRLAVRGSSYFEYDFAKEMS